MSGELRNTIAKRKIFLGDFEQADEDVFPSNVQFRGEILCNRCIKRLLLINRAPGQNRCLDDDVIIGPVDAEEITAVVVAARAFPSRCA